MDDTNATLSNPNKYVLNDLLCQDFALMKSWFEANGLLLNTSKTQTVIFHPNYSNSSKSDISFLDNVFNISQSTTFLGVHIDASLTWKEHIHALSNKLSKAYYLISFLSWVVDTETLLTVYYAYVYSHLSYGVVFWGDSVDVNKPFILQKKIVRKISHTKFDA